ncbi:MAG TPA: hypothetical protein VIZ00_06205 [Streptosporangiaceae bacterium]
MAEAYTRALLAWRTVRRHPAPEARVVRTALNTGVSWWRRRRREVPLDDHATAAVLGIAPGTVGAHLSRAVAALRAALPHDTDPVPAGQEVTR